MTLSFDFWHEFITRMSGGILCNSSTPYCTPRIISLSCFSLTLPLKCSCFKACFITGLKICWLSTHSFGRSSFTYLPFGSFVCFEVCMLHHQTSESCYYSIPPVGTKPMPPCNLDIGRIHY